MLPVITSLQQLHKEARDMALSLHELMMSLVSSSASSQEIINSFLEKEKNKCKENPERFVELSNDVPQIWQELEDALASGQPRDEIRHIVYCNWTIMNHIVSGIAHMNILRE